jgi:hypothetical protein
VRRPPSISPSIYSLETRHDKKCARPVSSPVDAAMVHSRCGARLQIKSSVASRYSLFACVTRPSSSATRERQSERSRAAKVARRIQLIEPPPFVNGDGFGQNITVIFPSFIVLAGSGAIET